MTLARSWLLVACLAAPMAAAGQSAEEVPIPAAQLVGADLGRELSNAGDDQLQGTVSDRGPRR